MSSFDLTSVDRFVAGAIGLPGDRTFFFQALAGSTVVSFKAEKVQVAALAEHMQQVLADLPPSSAEGEVSATSAPGLDLPVFAEWDVGAIGIGYERESDSFVIVLNELDRSGSGREIADDETSESEDSLARARFRLTRPQAAAFARNSLELVRSGRPMCLFCGSPIDTDGFNCACFN